MLNNFESGFRTWFSNLDARAFEFIDGRKKPVWNEPGTGLAQSGLVGTLCWRSPLFQAIQRCLGGAGAFFAMAVADGAVAFLPQLALYGSIAVSVVALGLAVTFTLRYPAHAARKMA